MEGKKNKYDDDDDDDDDDDEKNLLTEITSVCFTFKWNVKK